MKKSVAEVMGVGQTAFPHPPSMIDPTMMMFMQQQQQAMQQQQHAQEAAQQAAREREERLAQRDREDRKMEREAQEKRDQQSMMFMLALLRGNIGGGNFGTSTSGDKGPLP